MVFQNVELPSEGDDPIVQLLLDGRAETVDEAEEMYLDASWPALLDLVRSGRSDEELARHPLILLLLSRGSRAWEDSLL
jgi:hypothetical protein